MNIFNRFKLNLFDDRKTKRLVYADEYKFTLPPQKILDFGAHKGIATEYFAKKYPNTPIHAYEPNPKLFRKLHTRMSKYPNVRTFNEAIAHDGSVEFAISERNVSSSLFGKGEKITIPSISVKTAVERIGIPVSIKIDIEGAEYEALEFIPKGVQEILGELHPEKAGRSNEEMRTLLTKGGFLTVKIDTHQKCFFSAK